MSIEPPRVKKFRMDRLRGGLKARLTKEFEKKQR
jgi:hypothetical protein